MDSMPFCVLFGLRFRVFGVLSSLRLCFLFIEKEKEHEVAWVGDGMHLEGLGGGKTIMIKIQFIKKCKNIVKIHIKVKILKIQIKKLNVFSVYLNQNISCSWNIIE